MNECRTCKIGVSGPSAQPQGGQQTRNALFGGGSAANYYLGSYWVGATWNAQRSRWSLAQAAYADDGTYGPSDRAMNDARQGSYMMAVLMETEIAYALQYQEWISITGERTRSWIGYKGPG